MTDAVQPTSAWPEGLSYFLFSAPLEPGAFDTEGFLAAVDKDTKVVRYGDEAATFRVAIASDVSGRVNLGPDTDGDAVLRFTFSQGGSEGISLDALVLALRSAFAQGATPVGFGYASFSLAQSGWKPRVTLPIAAPGVVEGSPPDFGIPHLSGVELTYPSADLPLRRLGVSVYPNAQFFNVSQMVRVPLLEGNFYSELSSRLLEYLAMVASRVVAAPVDAVQDPE